MKRTVTEFEVLSRAFEILQQRGWCQGREAIDKRGEHRWASSKQAVKFCAVGAVIRAGRDLGAPVEMTSQIRCRFYQMLDAPVSLWNDRANRTLSQVLALFQRAASEARDEGEK